MILQCIKCSLLIYIISIIIQYNIIFFSKVAIDVTDGLLARVKYKPTKFGAILDQWAGLV